MEEDIKILEKYINGKDTMKESLVKAQDIKKQDNAINKMTKYIEEITGSCPYDTFDYQVRDCEKECKNQMAECWKEYFINNK